MKNNQKFIIGIILTIIGLGLLLFHMIQYIDLIERINVLALLLGGEGIDSASIILEIFLGFFVILLGVFFLGSLYKKEIITQEPKDILAQRTHYCQNCGKEIISNAKFCRKCGHDISI